MRRSLARSRLWIDRGISLILAVLLPSSAAERPSVFEEANRLYEQGKYAEAVSHYESILKGGQGSASVYFNLGNAHFKLDQLGQALLNFRRAEALSPRDPDIQANLRFTRDRVSGSISVRPIPRFLNYFTLNELGVATGLLFWAWAALFCAIKVRPSLRAALKTLQIVTAVAFGVSLILLIASLSARRERVAIITSPRSTVHLGPLPESQAAFTVAEGTELRLLETRPDWLQVSDRSGRTGWLPATNAGIFRN